MGNASLTNLHTSGQTKRLSRMADLERRLAEAEETLHAIRNGEVDALVVNAPEGEQIFTLRGAEASYRILVEAMNEGAMLLMTDGTILYANSRFAAMAGVPLENVTGVPIQRFFKEAEHGDLCDLLERASRAGTSKELNLLVQAGSPRPVWISVAPTRTGGIEGFSAVITDLTERKAAEAKVQEMIGELEGVSYAIVHDMRAPLRAMEAFAFMLSQDSPQHSEEHRKDLARRITTAAARLDRLIRDALTYNQLVVQATNLQAIDLTQLLRELLETYPNLAPSRADIHILDSFPRVMGSEALLTQCFANLLGNAVKFVADGVKPQVRVWAEPSNEFIRVWIEDNGIGIPLHAQPRLFRMFQRLTANYEGTGIGLAIVRKVVERMGGRVGAESAPGKGSRFWVELRRAGS